MKRSCSIQLALMGSVPLLFAAGCDRIPDQEPALLYQDLQQCIDDGQVSADVCQKGYEQALAAQQNGPRYGSLADCEAVYGWGGCHTYNNGSGSWFIPAATGFLIARALDAHQYAHYYGGYGGYYSSGYGGWTAQPLYQTRGDRGTWRTLSGQRFGWGVRGPAAYNSVAQTLSRGGFGRMAAARFSWGG